MPRGNSSPKSTARCGSSMKSLRLSSHSLRRTRSAISSRDWVAGWYSSRPSRSTSSRFASMTWPMSPASRLPSSTITRVRSFSASARVSPCRLASRRSSSDGVSDTCTPARAGELLDDAAEQRAVLLRRRQRQTERPDLRAQRLRQPDALAGEDEGARAAGESARRLAQQVGHVRLLEVRPQAVEHVQGRALRVDDVAQRAARVRRAVDAVGRAHPEQPGGAPPHEQRQLELPGRPRGEILGAVVLGGLDEQRPVP